MHAVSPASIQNLNDRFMDLYRMPWTVDDDQCPHDCPQPALNTGSDVAGRGSVDAFEATDPYQRLPKRIECVCDYA